MSVIAGCSSGDSTTTLTAPTSALGAPALDWPSHDAQVEGLRPELVIRNSGPSTATGPRSYEVQIASDSAFAAVVWSKTVPEQSGGTTIVVVDRDLAKESSLHWRARLVQGGEASDWSLPGTFRTNKGGYSRAGALWDPLTDGTTVGTTVGPVSFVAGKGIKLETENSYVRYRLAQTVSAGEFSMLVEGLRPNGPNHKLKIFSMSDGPDDFIASRYEAAAHYRGTDGNPNNAISLKVVWGNESIILEPNLSTRLASRVNLQSNRVYFWQAVWNSNSFRLIVRNSGPKGSIIYNRTFTTPSGAGTYSPSPHYAYLGANSGQFGSDAGTFPGMIIRDVWLGSGGRPAETLADR